MHSLTENQKVLMFSLRLFHRSEAVCQIVPTYMRKVPRAKHPLLNDITASLFQDYLMFLFLPRINTVFSGSNTPRYRGITTCSAVNTAEKGKYAL